MNDTVASIAQKAGLTPAELKVVARGTIASVVLTRMAGLIAKEVRKARNAAKLG
jgi:hypothetical protein